MEIIKNIKGVNKYYGKVILILSLLIIYLLPKPYYVLSVNEEKTRRVNMPYYTDEIDWGVSGIFWFGINEQGYPSRNYLDARLAYTPDALYIRTTIVDYYLWYKVDPTPTDDLTQYDSVAIYLDVNHDRSSQPQTDDYNFFVGSRYWPNENTPAYHRQARGTGTGWDLSWNGDWSEYTYMQWYCNPGPNSNDCGIDFGWSTTFSIPWETVGLQGPPPEETLWGLGVTLYDRDNEPPEGSLPSQSWPETFASDNPSTWGEIHYGYADYSPPQAVIEGTTLIRASSPEDNTVEDAFVGGGGTCSGGHEGGSDINYGADTSIFTASDTAPTHLPCFNKSFLRFSLDDIPPGKEIISATLTLHHWGNSDPVQAFPSWVHLFTISDPWNEMSITWNNAPLAQENISADWIYPLMEHPGWPGLPYTWDATQAVAEAYAQGMSANLAIYSSDDDQHKHINVFLSSSEVGDWDYLGRPTLTVTWGSALAELNKEAMPTCVVQGQTIAYTLTWSGTGQALDLEDQLPSGLSAPSSLFASTGQAIYDPVLHEITWSGSPANGEEVILTYTASAENAGPQTLRNTATLTWPDGGSSTSSATVLVDYYRQYLPYSNR